MEEHMSTEMNSTNSTSEWSLGTLKLPTEDDIKNPGFLIHLLSLVLLISWLTVLVFYTSQVYGKLVTKLVNRFMPSGHFSLDSLSWNFVAGKIMFKNLLYINEDLNIRVQDGFVIFKWWRPLMASGVAEGHQSSHSRLAVFMNGFELHVFNRSWLYAELEEFFDLEPSVIGRAEGDNRNKGGGSERLLNEKARKNLDTNHEPFYVTKLWRDMFPAIKIHLFSCRLVFGNRLSPTTLVVSVEEGHALYTTKPAISSVDPFMHAVYCDTENFKVLLARNENYTGIVEEAPRYMGEGFVILSSNTVQMYFRMDEAGLVPDTPQLVQLVNGETEELRPPIRTLDIKCGKGTNFSYGPWTDRQRDHLFKTFYPQSYQPQQPTRLPIPGERRCFQSFDIRVSMLNEATMDILFSKQRETKAFHMTAAPGSYLEITIPWLIRDDGCTTKVIGQLFRVEACTSLQFRNFAECERLEFAVNMHYPRIWNDHQEWTFTIGGSRVSTYIVYDHKDFFQDLISDWSSKSMPDILQFIPYTWLFTVKFTEFEIVIPANEHNWVDCSSQHQENFYVGFCGDLFDLSFSLPFCDFLPEVTELKLWIQGEVLELYLYLPPVNTNRDLLHSLMQEGKYVEMPGHPPFTKIKNRYQRFIKLDDGWLHCWSVPIIAFKFDFVYHSISPPGPPALSLMSTPEREDLLLTPIRAPRNKPKSVTLVPAIHPSTLDPDIIAVELEIGPSVIRFTGSLMLALLRLKDNVFGESQHFTDMDSSAEEAKINEALDSDFDLDPRLYRPLKVTVSLVMHDIEGHLVTACREGQTCPVVCIEQLAFEMEKSYTETRLQVMLSPILLSCSDSVVRSATDTHLRDGFAVVTGFQFRGHAMFSDEGRKIDEETLEYGWLMDFNIPCIAARLTVPQVLHIGSGVQSFLHLLLDEENMVVSPSSGVFCHHGFNQPFCRLTSQGSVCPTTDQLRYKMAKVVIERTELYLVESGTALKLEFEPIKISSCNLHSRHNQTGATIALQKIKVIQYMASNVHYNTDRLSNWSSSTTDTNKSKMDWAGGQRGLAGADLGPFAASNGGCTWLEIGLVELGPIYCDVAMSLVAGKAIMEGVQRTYLKLHDQKTRRLWFLWTADDAAGASTSASPVSVVGCGCRNGCTFFGSRLEDATGSNTVGRTRDGVTREYYHGESLLDRGKLLLNPALQSVATLNRTSTSTVMEAANTEALENNTETESQKSLSTVVHPGSSGEHSNSEETVVLREMSSFPRWKTTTPVRTHSSSVLSRHTPSFAGSYENGLRKPALLVREVSASTPAVNVPATASGGTDMTPSNSLEAQLSMRSSEQNSELFLSAEEYDSESTIGNDSDDDSERELVLKAKRSTIKRNHRNPSTGLGSLSSSLASSTSSFSSAVSSQNERELSLVDLHMQCNKPVSQSPLLMGTYLNHLTQVQCSQWVTRKSQSRQPAQSDFYRVPQYNQVTQGFTTLPMVPRENRLIPATPSPNPTLRQRRISNDSTWESPVINGLRNPGTSDPDIEEVMMADKTSVNCNTFVVKVVGPANIMLTPLVLESLQRFLDAASEYKSHSISVLTSIRSSCINAVLQDHSFLPEGLLEPSNSEISRKISRPVEVGPKRKTQTYKRSFGNIVAIQTQGSLSVEKVNICVLQAGVVEEVISFSALDSPRDLVCVSLLALCVDHFTLFGQTKKYVMQSYQSRAQHARNESFKTTKKLSKKVKNQAPTRPDQIILVLNQVKEDQTMVVLNTKRVHAQLRRLRNESSTLQRDAIITAIPPRCSRAMFTFDIKNVEGEKGNEYLGEFLKKVDVKEPDRPSEFGLIMLEAGVENITGKIIKKYPLPDPAQEEPGVTQRLQSISEDVESPVPQRNMKTTSFSTRAGTTSAAGKTKIGSQVSAVPEKATENTSFVAQFGSIWFGFAAPPRTPIMKKIEYTRLDWNLLSTSSPAISAWISCIDRFTLSVKNLDHSQKKWQYAVLAVLMAENLDLPRVEIPLKSKYAFYSTTSLAAREDPSTRLCMLLHKFLKKTDPKVMECALAEQHLPPADTTRQGLIVLLRQWKGAFVVPLVIENTGAPSKKGFLNVTFSRHLLERKKSDRSADGSSTGGGDSNSAGSAGGRHSSNSSIQKPEEGIVQHGALNEWMDAMNPLLSENDPQQRRRSSPIPSFGIFSSRNPTPLFGDNQSVSDGVSTPVGGQRIDLVTEEAQKEEHQLSWGNAAPHHETSLKSSFHRAGIAGGSFLKKFQRNDSSSSDIPGPVTSQIQGLNPGIEAHIVFAPMLRALGVTVDKAAPGTFAVSGTVSVVSGIDELKVDLFESEFMPASVRSSKMKRPLGKVTLSIPPEISAFSCETITFEAEAKGKQHDVSIGTIGFEEKKDAGTTVNFTLGVGFVAQQVNMPLLRLVHQIYTMYSNAQNVSNQLRDELQLPSMPLNIPPSESDASEGLLSTTSDSSRTLPPEQRDASRASSALRNDMAPNISVNYSAPASPITTLPRPPIMIYPKSWKKIFQLLDLYKAMPNQNTVLHRINERVPVRPRRSNVQNQKMEEKNRYSESVFGIVRITRVRLLAALSGLKLEADLSSIHSSLNYKEGVVSNSQKRDMENSVSCHLGQAMVVLLEGVAPSQQTVVKVVVGKSQGLYSVQAKRSDDLNSALISIGQILVDIPQHPAVLHGMMSRGTKELSTTLQEFRSNRISSRSTRTTSDDVPHLTRLSPVIDRRHESKHIHIPEPLLFQPLVMQFSFIIERISITAALLPSLEAEYQMHSLVSSGVTGSSAKFSVDLSKHSLSFNTKLQSTDGNIPPSACIELPAVRGSAEYLAEGTPSDMQLEDQMVLRKGGFLKASADIGMFEHCLTTDLLNHLVLVQKVFMKEINEVVQKVSGGDKLVPLWDDDESLQTSSRILYTLTVQLKGIQITATTATNSAVRFETDLLEVQLSNRVQNVSGNSKQKGSCKSEKPNKLFVSAAVDLNLSLGQLIQNVLFEEAEPEYIPVAFFRTKIGIRNALENELGNERESDQEVVFLSLTRPLIYLQPEAVDKAILVWLNYKNAYEYWKDQRSDLGKDSHGTADAFLDRMMSQRADSELSTLFVQVTVDDMGICLPLQQLPNMGMRNMSSANSEIETTNAVVVTLESSTISACISGCFVSKGEFSGLCLRFDDDFELNFDDWKPDLSISPMNRCVVSEGTYEICSRTVAQTPEGGNAKWFLNVGWQMEGLDAHLDVNIGQQLASLGRTLTRLTEGEDDLPQSTAPSTEDEAEDGETAPTAKYYLGVELRNPRPMEAAAREQKHRHTTPAVLRRRAQVVEKEMAEQSKLISELKTGGASMKRIEEELRKLQELESLAFKDFRRDIAQRFRRQSSKATSIKSKLGLGSSQPPKSRHRSGSIQLPSRPVHSQSITEGDIHPRSRSLLVPPILVVSEDEDDSKIESNASGASVPLSLRRVQRSQTVTSPPTSYDFESFDLPEEELELEEDEDMFLPLSSPEVEVSRSPPSMSETSSGRQSSMAHQRPQEPNVDLELNVKVVISSGKCVLYAADHQDLDRRRLRKDRSYSAEMGSQGSGPLRSPGSNRRKFEVKPTASVTKMKQFTITPGLPSDKTAFHIPGLDIKVLYESKMIPDDQELHRLKTVARTPTSLGSGGSIPKKCLIKKASLFTWMTLQSIPEETVVSPQILDFLEKALEPIPVTVPEQKPPSSDEGSRPSVFTLDLDGASATDSSSNAGSYGSFPVDVVVYFHMQPSAVRFSSLPVSRVECLLRFPSLYLVFSSKRMENNQLEGDSGGVPPNSRPGSLLPLGAVGGLSVTGCLSDFSLYVFHPYGGAKKGVAKSRDGTPGPAASSSDETPSAETEATDERKDSLSVNVEFVKFALSRSRKVDFVLAENPELGNKATIRFSTIVDIGSASFKYDMRRLAEILAFPKAWYRRGIVRRLFLGDLTKSEEPANHEDTPPQRNRKDARPKSQSDPETSGETKGRRHGRTSSDPRNIEGSARHRSLQIVQWETLVVYAVNFKKLNVHMNMGNVMGNIVWLTQDFRSDGKLSLSSTGHKDMSLGCGLGGSSLEAKGGIVGGIFDVSSIEMSVQIREDPNVEPEHRADLRLQAMECRMDYMGSSTLMSRCSNLVVSLRDEWKFENIQQGSGKDRRGSISLPTKRNAIYLHGDLGWDQFQMLISRSTTVDLIKMYIKLEEFFSQQFKSSRRLFSNIQQPRRPSMSSLKWKADKTNVEKNHEAPTAEPLHHRHWQSVLKQVSGLRLATLAFPLPGTETDIGGSIEFHGGHISLACFHGVNFKSKSWAVFSLKDPVIWFSTKANEDATGKVFVAESLSFSLGLKDPSAEEASNSTTKNIPAQKAMVTRVSRNQMFPPQCKTLHDWFMYAFASTDIDDVDKFPSVQRERLYDSAEKRSVSRSSDFNHQKEVIFEFPSLQMHLKTDHVQGPEIPDLKEPRPVVECRLITDFEEPILLTFDMETILFLHDLIASYLKEKEKLNPAASSRNQVTDTQGSLTPKGELFEQTAKTKSADSHPAAKEQKRTIIMTEEDWRTFECKDWHLEPAFRLLAFTGQKLDPIGVDYILNKLGFSHARTTIPKWLQRGAMDPLDRLLAILMGKALALLAKKSDLAEAGKKNF